MGRIAEGEKTMKELNDFIDNIIVCVGYLDEKLTGQPVDVNLRIIDELYYRAKGAIAFAENFLGSITHDEDVSLCEKVNDAVTLAKSKLRAPIEKPFYTYRPSIFWTCNDVSRVVGDIESHYGKYEVLDCFEEGELQVALNAKRGLYTFDVIYDRAVDTGYGDPRLKARDWAEWEIECLMTEEGIDLSKCECKEDWFFDYADEHDLLFHEDGTLVRQN